MRAGPGMGRPAECARPTVRCARGRLPWRESTAESVPFSASEAMSSCWRGRAQTRACDRAPQGMSVPRSVASPAPRPAFPARSERMKERPERMQKVASDRDRGGRGKVDAARRELVGDDPLSLIVSQATSSGSDPGGRGLHGLLVGSEPAVVTLGAVAERHVRLDCCSQARAVRSQRLTIRTCGPRQVHTNVVVGVIGGFSAEGADEPLRRVAILHACIFSARRRTRSHFPPVPQ